MRIPRGRPFEHGIVCAGPVEFSAQVIKVSEIGINKCQMPVGREHGILPVDLYRFEKKLLSLCELMTTHVCLAKCDSTVLAIQACLRRKQFHPGSKGIHR